MNRPFPKSSLIALDIETTGLNFLHDEITVITLSDGEDTILLKAPFDPELTYWLHNEVYDRTVVIQNAMFDLPFLAHTFGCGYPAQVWDTMICEQMLTAGLGDKSSNDRQERVGLKDLTLKYLGIELDKTLQVSDWSGDLTPEQIEYATQDAKILIPLVKEQQKVIDRENLHTIWDIEMASIPVWCSMKEKGIYLDPDVLKPIIDTAQKTMDELGQHLQEELTFYVQDLRIQKFDEKMGPLQDWLHDLERETRTLEKWWYTFWEDWKHEAILNFDLEEWEENHWDDEELHPKTGKPWGMERWVKHQLKVWRQNNPRPTKPKLIQEPINLGSSEQVKFALEAYLGLEVENTRAFTLKRLIPEVDEEEKRKLLRDLLEYRDVEKLVQSFGDTLISQRDSEGYIHAEWNPYGTATGRPSCSSPNLLQIPKRKAISKKMRAAFKPAPGHVFIVCDYAQAELRILADMARDSAFIKAFKLGIDVHTQGARDILGKDDVSDMERTLSKTLNLGIPYGMGVNKLILSANELGVHLTKDEANKFLEGWKSTHKQAWAYLLRQQNKAVKDGWTQTPLGRRRWFQVEEGEYLGTIQRAGANHTIQGTNADISKIAMACIQHALRPLGGRVALQVYDELVIEVPEEHAKIGAMIVRESMLEAERKVLKYVPPAVDCMVSRSWSEEDEIDGLVFHG